MTQDTTDVPDAESPTVESVLGTALEAEWTDVLGRGEYRLQYKESTGDDSDGSSGDDGDESDSPSVSDPGAGDSDSVTLEDQGDIDPYLQPDGEVTIPGGSYVWNGGTLDIGSDDALICNEPMEVNFEGETITGTVDGTLKNFVIRGDSTDDRAGFYPGTGCTMEGVLQLGKNINCKDRFMYTGDLGFGDTTFRKCAWNRNINNGAYLDKGPTRFERCVAANNNIANIRVGCRETGGDGDVVVQDCLVAVTTDVPYEQDFNACGGDGNVQNARGIRLRQPCDTLRIENCWLVYTNPDVSASGMIIFFDDTEPMADVIEITNCHFHNDTSNDMIRQKGDADYFPDIRINDCTVSGDGRHNFDGTADWRGNGWSYEEKRIPTPTEITEYDAADDIAGVGPGFDPWPSESEKGSYTSSTTSS